MLQGGHPSGVMKIPTQHKPHFSSCQRFLQLHSLLYWKVKTSSICFQPTVVQVSALCLCRTDILGTPWSVRCYRPACHTYTAHITHPVVLWLQKTCTFYSVGRILAESEDMDLFVGKELQKKSQREAMRKGSEEIQDGQDDHENTSREDEGGGPDEWDAAIECMHKDITGQILGRSLRRWVICGTGQAGPFVGRVTPTVCTVQHIPHKVKVTRVTTRTWKQREMRSSACRISWNVIGVSRHQWTNMR